MELMTTREVAQYLRVSVATIHDWRTSKIGPPAMKVGRNLLWRRDSVDAWLLRQGETAEPQPAVAVAG
jgi:excisionase family DNA binding protein